jgi:hypothetical protein
LLGRDLYLHGAVAAEPKLLAWIEPGDDENECVAAFVGGSAPDRPPATRVCATPNEARKWVETEAYAGDAINMQ